MQALPGAHPGQVAGMPAGFAAAGQAGLAGLTGAGFAGLSAQQVRFEKRTIPNAEVFD